MKPVQRKEKSLKTSLAVVFHYIQKYFLSRKRDSFVIVFFVASLNLIKECEDLIGTCSDLNSRLKQLIFHQTIITQPLFFKSDKNVLKTINRVVRYSYAYTNQSISIQLQPH